MKIAASALKRHPQIVPPSVKEAAEKTEKVSLSWAKLIARIYETNPLLCTCGKEIKIIAFVTHAAEIRRILTGIGWPTEPPEFDEPDALFQWDICQLVPGTKDGFPEPDQQVHIEDGPDPPNWDIIDPPHWQDNSDPPHWAD